MVQRAYLQVGAWPLRWARAAGPDLSDAVIAGGVGAPAFEQYARARVASDATQSGAQGFGQIGGLIVNIVSIPLWLVVTAILTLARLLGVLRWRVVTIDDRGRRSEALVRGLRAARGARLAAAGADRPA